MKLARKNSQESEAEKGVIHLPYGLIGLPEMQRFEIAPMPGSWPLLSIRSAGSEELRLIVIEPNTLIAGYELEITDEDAELLRLDSADDALIYNIVTIHSLEPQYLTVNLVGPIVLNRHTSIGKQVIIANFEHYSAEHALIDDRQKDDAA
ncbi:MAG TPA: flagellar assembly protein FliW [Chthoniobacterales bacterium]|jgi:flagellar assembly factor FliW|nr:flagellar assembly protein FliW [Chthoniobacterales bacterium]